jgi:integrase
MARSTEVAALTVGDINRDSGAVRINKAFKYAGTGWQLGPPKTKRGVRTVNVPFETLDLLDLERPHDALLFHTRRGTPYFYQEAFLLALRELIEVDDQSNVVIDRLEGKRPSPYTLRHTGISWRLLGGVPMFVVSRDVGHNSYDTTDKRYEQLDRTASAEAAQVLAAKIQRLNNLPEPTRRSQARLAERPIDQPGMHPVGIESGCGRGLLPVQVSILRLKSCRVARLRIVWGIFSGTFLRDGWR